MSVQYEGTPPAGASDSVDDGNQEATTKVEQATSMGKRKRTRHKNRVR